mmetsp:Transcript_31110/g.88852  ORF Transcript_31110/g.88852 Transcript_31110/m.88852 type:complete len:234 (+) Transcript_31110:488-1189(+)
MQDRQKAWSQLSRMPKRSPFLRMLSKQMPHSGSSASKDGSSGRRGALALKAPACELRHASPKEQRPARKWRHIGNAAFGAPRSGSGAPRSAAGAAGARKASSWRNLRVYSSFFSIFLNWFPCKPSSPASRRCSKAAISRKAFWSFRTSFSSTSSSGAERAALPLLVPASDAPQTVEHAAPGSGRGSPAQLSSHCASCGEAMPRCAARRAFGDWALGKSWDKRHAVPNAQRPCA